MNEAIVCWYLSRAHRTLRIIAQQTLPLPSFISRFFCPSVSLFSTYSVYALRFASSPPHSVVECSLLQIVVFTISVIIPTRHQRHRHPQLRPFIFQLLFFWLVALCSVSFPSSSLSSTHKSISIVVTQVLVQNCFFSSFSFFFFVFSSSEKMAFSSRKWPRKYC